MHEIKCPKCGEVFQVDESGYAELLSQVRNEAFEEELHKRARELEDKNKSDLKMAQMQQEKSFAETISDKDKEIANKDMEIQKLKNQIAMGDSEKKLAITEAIRDNIPYAIFRGADGSLPLAAKLPKMAMLTGVRATT